MMTGEQRAQICEKAQATEEQYLDYLADIDKKEKMKKKQGVLEYDPNNRSVKDTKTISQLKSVDVLKMLKGKAQKV